MKKEEFIFSWNVVDFVGVIRKLKCDFFGVVVYLFDFGDCELFGEKYIVGE